MNKYVLSALVCVFCLLGIGMWAVGFSDYFLGGLKTAWIVGASLLTQCLLLWMVVKKKPLDISWWWFSGLSLICLPLWFVAFFYGGFYLVVSLGMFSPV